MDIFLFRLREDGGDEDDDSGEDEDEDVDEDGDGVRKGPFKGRMMGTDYSQKSIEFARRIAEDKGFGEGTDGVVEFKYWDVMNDDPKVCLDGPNADGWDVILDKGTFDAISLSSEKDAQGRRIFEGYKERIVPLMRDGGLLLITSCNWTEEELRHWFEGGELVYEDTIKYPSFSFGGKKGQTISSVCFRKRKRG